MAGKPGGWGKRRLYALVAIVAGLAAIGSSAYSHWHWHALATHGHTAVVESITAYDRSTSRRITTYTADFHWKLQGSGRAVQKRTSFPEAVLEDLRAHREVRIYYDPDDPGDFVFENGKPGWRMIGGGAVVVLVALAFL
jgi:hypothetical protein